MTRISDRLAVSGCDVRRLRAEAIEAFCDEMSLSRLFLRARRQLGQMDSNHISIARGAMLVGLFVVIGRLFTLLREIALAQRYGVGQTADAYQVAYAAAGLLTGALVAALTVGAIPPLVRFDADPIRRAALLSSMHRTAVLVGGALTLALAAGAHAFVGIVGGALADQTREAAADMLVAISPVAMLMLVAGSLSVQLQARERHINALFEGVPAVALATVVFLTAESAYDAAPLAWGTNLSVGFQIGCLAWFLISVGDFRLFRRGATWTEDWALVVRSTLVVLAGQLAMGIIVPIDQFFASTQGEGAIASVGYVNRFVTLLFGLGATAIARALLPVLSRVANDSTIIAGKVTATWALLALVAGVLLAAAMTIFASPLIALVLERGAFSSADTAIVASLFRSAVWQLPFYFCGLVFAQFLVSLGRYRIFATIGLANLVVKVVGNAILVPQFGLTGLMIASVLMYAASCAALAWAAWRARS